MGKKLEDLKQSDEDEFIDSDVVCLRVLYSDEDKQKCLITDKSEANARLQIGGETGLPYLEATGNYELKNIQVIQAGESVEDKDYNAFLIARSKSEINKI